MVDCMMCLANMAAGAPTTGLVYVRDGVAHSTSRLGNFPKSDALTCEIYYEVNGGDGFWSFLGVTGWIKWHGKP